MDLPIVSQIAVFGRMIKFSHTLFALPFALSAMVLAHRQAPLTPMLFAWLLLAMVGARSAAMGFNRIIDAHLDALNPRTAKREIPRGAISRTTAMVLVFTFSLLFLLAAGMISRLCLYLAPPVLFILFGYSYTKRFTALAHIYLGLCISLAPLGTWIAVTGTFSPEPLCLSLALATYIAGFDILYACQDTAFDQRLGLHSIPARYGPERAFQIAALLHGVAFAAFVLLGRVFALGSIYHLTVGLIGLLFIIEHRLINPKDLTHIRIAFFHINSAISVILFCGIMGDELLRGIL